MADLELIDMGSIAHPIWATTSQERVTDTDIPSTQIAKRCRELAGTTQHVVIACDGGGHQFRKDIAKTYKANRPERDAGLQYQIDLAQNLLANDGFPVWMQPGTEADDIIASAVTYVLSLNDTATVLVHSADKDLLQLVGPRVTVRSPNRGNFLFTEATVVEKFGVTPAQIRDYLTIVGDAADNITGVKGVGEVNAKKILAQWGTLDAFIGALKLGPTVSQAPPRIQLAFSAFLPELATTRALITLKTDIVLPWDEWLTERRDRVTHTFADLAGEQPEIFTEPLDPTPTEVVVDEAPAPAPPLAPEPKPAVATPAPISATMAAPVSAPAISVSPKSTTGMTRTAPVQGVVVTEFEKQLEPQSLPQAQDLAMDIFKSRLYGGYANPQAVLVAIMAGRDWGLTATASMRAFHIVEGKPTLAADFMRSLVKNSGKAVYFRCTERTATRATFVTRRKDDPDYEYTLSYTIEEATIAGLVKDKSGWVKNPADMLVARAGAKICRLAFEELFFGAYAPEEMDTYE